MKNGVYIFLCLMLFIAAAVPAAAQEKAPASNALQEKSGAAQKKSFVLKRWGLIGPDFIGDHPTAWKIYKDLLEKYNITFQWVGGCTYVEDEPGAIASNELTTKAIEAEYDAGILKKVERQAEAEYEGQYGPADRERWAKALEELQKRIEIADQHKIRHEHEMAGQVTLNFFQNQRGIF